MEGEVAVYTHTHAHMPFTALARVLRRGHPWWPTPCHVHLGPISTPSRPLLAPPPAGGLSGRCSAPLRTEGGTSHCLSPGAGFPATLDLFHWTHLCLPLLSLDLVYQKSLNRPRPLAQARADPHPPDVP